MRLRWGSRGYATGTGPGPTLRWVSPAEARLAADRSLTRALEAVVRRRG